MKSTRALVALLLVSFSLSGCLSNFGEEIGSQTPPTCPNGEPCVCIDVDGTCEDGDDDWGFYEDGFLRYYCSNDDRSYAQDMGGIYCPDAGTSRDNFDDIGFTPPVAPICPNGEPCVCIDVDGTCADGDDDWGYYEDGDERYYCSNDGRDYAEAMGGIYCPDAEPVSPCETHEAFVMSNNTTEYGAADFSCMDLTGLDFSNANLTGADLSFAILSQTNLTGAVLDYADFTGAIFADTVLMKVSIKDTLCPSGDEMLWDDDLNGVCV